MDTPLWNSAKSLQGHSSLCKRHLLDVGPLRGVGDEDPVEQLLQLGAERLRQRRDVDLHDAGDHGLHAVLAVRIIGVAERERPCRQNQNVLLC